MEKLLGLGDGGKCNNTEFIQEVSRYLWLKNGDSHKDMYTMITGLRVANECYKRLNKDEEIEKLKIECLKEILKFIKNNPRASESQLQNEVLKHVKNFKFRVENL